MVEDGTGGMVGHGMSNGEILVRLNIKTLLSSPYRCELQIIDGGKTGMKLENIITN